MFSLPTVLATRSSCDTATNSFLDTDDHARIALELFPLAKISCLENQ